MKLLWLCNRAPSAVSGGSGGVWMDSVLDGLRNQENMEIRILFPDESLRKGAVDDRCSFASFVSGKPYQYLAEQETFFETELQAYQPEVIHIWGTEYAHTLAMVNAARTCGFLHRIVVHIQGLCSIYAAHYAEGVPFKICSGYTLRDLLRQDNIAQQQNKFALRGELEVQALQKVCHVIGRTDWDLACAEQINPEAIYHFGNETLRAPFYEGQWKYADCRKHRIFASSCAYPIKGFHYLLEAFAEVLKSYPDATLAVPGKSCFPESFKERLLQDGYRKYLAALIRKHGLEGKVEFLGSLSAEQMKENYLAANVFVLPSTIENSPNSLGEAMLLGVPCVAGDVGGVSTMMTHNQEGFIYQSTAPYMLAHYIKRVFAMEDQTEQLGSAAKLRAAQTHDPQKNLQDLMEIYKKIAE